MIDFHAFQFAAPPRTGNGWILEACKLVGLAVADTELAFVPFPKNRGENELFRVTLVRNPCDWLRSCYAAMLNGDVKPIYLSAFGRLPKGSFRDFVDRYLAIMPGGIGHLFNCYRANSHIKVEDLPFAFLELLESLEVPKSLSMRCRDLPRQNVSIHLPRWEKQLRARVIQAERELCETYDYC